MLGEQPAEDWAEWVGQLQRVRGILELLEALVAAGIGKALGEG